MKALTPMLIHPSFHPSICSQIISVGVHEQKSTLTPTATTPTLTGSGNRKLELFSFYERHPFFLLAASTQHANAEDPQPTRTL